MDRPTAVALLGDEIYESGMSGITRWCHPILGITLDVASTCGGAAFAFSWGSTTIVGDGSPHRWTVDDLVDPRNDPEYDPFK